MEMFMKASSVRISFMGGVPFPGPLVTDMKANTYRANEQAPAPTSRSSMNIRVAGMMI